MRQNHIIGVYQPYGIYFHEPNTLVMAPQSIGTLGINFPKYTRIEFGINSEVQDFTRELFKDSSDEDTRKMMLFSAYTVLSTSLKSNDKTFAIRFSGEFDQETRKFKNWKQDDLISLRGMHQEILDPNTWASNLCTGFKYHLVHDARAEVSELFNIFDPYALAGDYPEGNSYEEKLYRLLRSYDETLSQEDLRGKFNLLRAHYDKQKQGDLISFYLLSIAWETGQMIRIMYYDYLDSPIILSEVFKLHLPPVPSIEATKITLQRRLAYASDHGHPAPSQEVITLLGLNKVPYRMTNYQIVQTIVKAIYKEFVTKKKTAEVLNTSSSTVTKFLEGQSSPIKEKELRERFNEGENFGLDKTKFNRVRAELF